MKHLAIQAAARQEFGKKESRAVRVAGSVPCVVYGGGDTVHFSIKNVDLKQLLFTPQSYIIDLDIDGKKEVAVMRDVQFHPITDEPIHIDFYRVLANKAISIDLPVTLLGNSEGVKQGGKLALSKRKLRVLALEKNLPDSIDVDVTSLGLGKSIFVGDLNLEGITILTPATTAICAVRTTRVARDTAANAEVAAAGEPAK
ncbi:MAG: 50S ribosomal protein L25/general stress protein Ctc [Mucinivorans sp.]